MGPGNKYQYEYLKNILPEERITTNEPMSRHTTFRVGGPADIFIRPAEIGELSSLIRYVHLAGREYFLLGNGSNLLVGDMGYRGIMIQLDEHFSQIQIRDNILTAGAGARLGAAAAAARDAGLSGLEFASGIPGTIGGAMAMNAGAYGGEMSDVVRSVRLMTRDGDEVVFTNKEMKFGYRRSIVRGNELVVTQVEMELTPSDREAVSRRMDELSEERRKKQPLEFPSAGSTFKRPEGYFAGKLIMDAGLSGFCIGGAMVSQKHCGFVVNTGSAQAIDILDVIREVQDKVKDRFGVSLETEVQIIGEF